jgi:exodeoxyribonuclease V alpha subunit
MAETLSGIIERITFHNADTGFAVLQVQAGGKRGLTTVVGTTPAVVAGEYVEASGAWAQDRNHGLQFKAETLQITPPHTLEGITKYLGSGLVKGIGPHFAKKIVAVFGERTLQVIDESPTFLSEVKGIGPQRLDRIRKSWEEQKNVRAIMVFLQSHGIGTARAVRIYKTYGEQAIEKVRANPYQLATDIWGVGFKTADELAQKLGLPLDAPQRLRAALRFVLQELSSAGHVGYPEQAVLEQTSELIGIDLERLHPAVEHERQQGDIIRDSPRRIAGAAAIPESMGDVDADWLFLKPLFLAEQGIARALHRLRQGKHPLPTTDLNAAVDWVEQKMALQLAPQQRHAIQSAGQEKVLVITGGPGVGKSTLVRGIVEIFAARALRVGLCAPTGRAAKRLTESTGREAKTIHRLLEFDPVFGGFKRDREMPLELDLLIVDEASMVDTALMYALTRAIPAWACLVVVGDIDQLPSVGPGSILADLIRSEVLPVVRLTQVFRQAEASFIIRAAHAVNAGELPASAPTGTGDFFFMEVDEPAKIIDRILTMIRERIPARFGLDPVRDVQVLAPMHRTELGVGNLNERLQAALNPPTSNKAVQRFGTTFRPGDKVLQTQNNYQREVYNGDVGRIVDIDESEGELAVEFDGRLVTYEFSELDELSLAYTLSIHKSQGSEYPAVIIPVHTQHYVMLQRNLLYTGLTRGKKLVVLIGSKKALSRAVSQQDTARRFTLLAGRLRAAETQD